MINKTKEQIRMELYKEVYLQYSKDQLQIGHNTAANHAKRAVDAFNETFKEVDL